jgi:hypothetical protein
MIKGNPGTTLTDAVCIHHVEEIKPDGERGPAGAAVNPEFSEALMGFSPGWTEID